MLMCACTPREIEREHSQTSVEEMPRPGGAVRHVLDSIKQELTIKRIEKEAMQRMMDSLERKFIMQDLEKDARER